MISMALPIVGIMFPYSLVLLVGIYTGQLTHSKIRGVALPWLLSEGESHSHDARTHLPDETKYPLYLVLRRTTIFRPLLILNGTHFA